MAKRKNEISSEQSLFNELSQLIEQSQLQVAAQVNSTLTMLFWHIGYRINQNILQNKRADYGKQIVVTLSRQLTGKYGRNFEEKNLRRMLQFAEQFSNEQIVVTLSRQLSWSHILALLPLKNVEAKLFYANSVANGGLGVRELRKKISGKEFERTAIANLQNTRNLRRLVAIELKLGKFEAKHKGQMELYLKWLDRYEKKEGELPPVGLILCAESSREQVELLEMHKDGIIVAEYWTELPPKKELEKKIHNILIEAKERIERKKLLE